jgi:hypothetical protein
MGDIEVILQKPQPYISENKAFLQEALANIKENPSP